jgi:hypothetical protein
MNNIAVGSVVAFALMVFAAVQIFVAVVGQKISEKILKTDAKGKYMWEILC